MESWSASPWPLSSSVWSSLIAPLALTVKCFAFLTSRLRGTQRRRACTRLCNATVCCQHWAYSGTERRKLRLMCPWHDRWLRPPGWQLNLVQRCPSVLSWASYDSNTDSARFLNLPGHGYLSRRRRKARCRLTRLARFRFLLQSASTRKPVRSVHTPPWPEPEKIHPVEFEGGSAGSPLVRWRVVTAFIFHTLCDGEVQTTT